MKAVAAVSDEEGVMGETPMMDAAPGDPIRYATELELCRAHRSAWLQMQQAIEANDTHAVDALARRVDEILSALREENRAVAERLEARGRPT
jgi:hypothetical protein